MSVLITHLGFCLSDIKKIKPKSPAEAEALSQLKSYLEDQLLLLRKLKAD